ncbi:MAG: hypothetical protein D6785_13445, partial [Planctomycetota bacterium]
FENYSLDFLKPFFIIHTTENGDNKNLHFFIFPNRTRLVRNFMFEKKFSQERKNILEYSKGFLKNHVEI